MWTGGFLLFILHAVKPLCLWKALIHFTNKSRERVLGAFLMGKLLKKHPDLAARLLLFPHVRASRSSQNGTTRVSDSSLAGLNNSRQAPVSSPSFLSRGSKSAMLSSRPPSVGFPWYFRIPVRAQRLISSGLHWIPRPWLRWWLGYPLPEQLITRSFEEHVRSHMSAFVWSIAYWTS